MPSVWKEYSKGWLYNGVMHPPLQRLEATKGAKWRKGSSTNSLWEARKFVCYEVEQQIKEGADESTACKMVEQMRVTWSLRDGSWEQHAALNPANAQNVMTKTDLHKLLRKRHKDRKHPAPANTQQ